MCPPSACTTEPRPVLESFSVFTVLFSASNTPTTAHETRESVPAEERSMIGCESEPFNSWMGSVTVDVRCAPLLLMLDCNRRISSVEFDRRLSASGSMCSVLSELIVRDVSVRLARSTPASRRNDSTVWNEFERSSSVDLTPSRRPSSSQKPTRPSLFCSNARPMAARPASLSLLPEATPSEVSVVLVLSTPANSTASAGNDEVQMSALVSGATVNASHSRKQSLPFSFCSSPWPMLSLARESRCFESASTMSTEVILACTRKRSGSAISRPG
mmetsp:Transcript_72510/g.144010  ORF Transcript_72510/g.144010 Transcript_72510/m.144010 type:complete len:273 (-) Transcript_72510:538-1356(-)